VANEDLILEILKRVQADVADTRRRCESMEIRMSAFEDFLRGLQTAYAGVHSNLSQINARVGRMEHRLDLA